MIKFILSLIALFTLCEMNAQEITDQAVKAPLEVQKIYDTLMIGTLKNDIDVFHSVCDSGMKTAITKLKLASVNEAVSGLITEKEKGEYIGFYLKDGIEVYLYKIIQKANMDDLLVILSVKNDKCVGLLFQ